MQAGGTQFVEGGQGIGMAFIKLAQAQVLAGDPPQSLPALQGLAAARHRQLIEAGLHHLPQAIAQRLRGVQARRVDFKKCVQIHVQVPCSRISSNSAIERPLTQ